MSVYAISDLHGMLYLYQEVKKFLKPEDKVYCLGDCGIDTCIARNSLREGFSQVPESAIRKMARNYRSPTPAEFELYKYGFKEVRINHHGME